ncbi:MAG: thioredoxin family protein [Acidimicrobiia bacterium]
MTIEVLGSGCANCKELEARTADAIASLGIEASIVKVTDFAEIASRGVMSTPALTVNGRVLVTGRVPSTAEVTTLISSAAP